ncbi:glycoside hydrolase family 71 protein [Peniophora sp. CONT]|nr:glycoside hydrolase family 71 protein [Peniophora sp. CONT]
MQLTLALVAAALSLFGGALAAPALEPRATTKYVFAHHIVGNTAPYTQSTWAADIALAQANGIDGFALNVGSDSWEIAQVASAYAAAAAAGTGFKLFLSLDMSANPCAALSDGAPLRAWVNSYYNHPNQFIYNSKVYLSTFAGETCTFGQGSVVAGWKNAVISQLTGSQSVYFVPFFSVDPATFSSYSGVINGAMNWNAGWPISLNAGNYASLAGTVSNIDGSTTDSQYLSGLSSIGGSYLATVSPWFYTHYSPSTYNKNWIYYADNWMYAARWEKLVAERNSIDVVEVVSWNDYGESHYIGPVEGALPLNAGDWVNNFPHTAWLSLTNYYAQAFKSGSYATPTQDKIILWVRPHPAGATATSDSVGKPTNYQMDSDTVWVVVLATSSATVTLTTGTTQTTTVPAGLTKLSIPITAGNGVKATMSRGTTTAVTVQPSFTFNGSPTLYNYNVLVASN